MGNLGEVLQEEHDGWKCESCGSDWIRYEHLDYKDCDEFNCEDPCLERCCNEENCAGVAIYKGEGL